MTHHSPFALFRDDPASRSLVFDRPKEIVMARTAAEVLPALRRLEDARLAGHWLAGYISYEAGYIFEDKLRHLIADNRPTPLIVMGIFDHPSGNEHPLAGPPGTVIDDGSSQGSFLSEPHAMWDLATYRERFDRLHQHLRNGDCYQANLTMPVTARWHGDPLSAFWSLVARQPVRYGAFVDLGGNSGEPVILSRSPELFFAVDADGFIETHPMKGTARAARPWKKTRRSSPKCSPTKRRWPKTA